MFDLVFGLIISLSIIAESFFIYFKGRDQLLNQLLFISLLSFSAFLTLDLLRNEVEVDLEVDFWLEKVTDGLVIFSSLVVLLIALELLLNWKKSYMLLNIATFTSLLMMIQPKDNYSIVNNSWDSNGTLMIFKYTIIFAGIVASLVIFGIISVRAKNNYVKRKAKILALGFGVMFVAGIAGLILESLFLYDDYHLAVPTISLIGSTIIAYPFYKKY